MTFHYPHVLWLLALVVPLLTVFLIWAWMVKRRLVLQFVRSRLLAHLTVGVSEKRQKFRMALLVAATACVLLALARPQWGFDYEEIRQKGLDIVLAIDTSRSMLAEDVPPNRLTRAKLAAMDINKLAATDRLGLVAFAGSAFLQCPLSFDSSAFQQSVQTLDTAIIPQGGTALSEAIVVAQTAFKEKNDNHKVLILLTDGEDHDGEALEAARKAAQNGMRIFTVGLGTRNGELLRINDGQGRTEYLKDEQGQVVKSRLNEKLLQDIAQATQGFYMHLSGPNTMEVLYERGLAPLPKSNLASKRMKRFHERFQWLLGLAILILAVEFVLPEQRRVRRADTEMKLATEMPKVVALLLFALPVLASGSDVSKAWKAYQKGNYTAAQLAYEKALTDNPKDARLHFNAGVAAFRSQDFETAEKHLESALVSPDLNLQQSGYYNLGNTQYRIGERTEAAEPKQQSWEQAIQSYETALRLNPQDAQAKQNLEFVRRRLEELKQQQQQQQESPDKDKKKSRKISKRRRIRAKKTPPRTSLRIRKTRPKTASLILPRSPRKANSRNRKSRKKRAATNLRTKAKRAIASPAKRRGAKKQMRKQAKKPLRCSR